MDERALEIHTTSFVSQKRPTNREMEENKTMARHWQVKENHSNRRIAKELFFCVFTCLNGFLRWVRTIPIMFVLFVLLIGILLVCISTITIYRQLQRFDHANLTRCYPELRHQAPPSAFEEFIIPSYSLPLNHPNNFLHGEGPLVGDEDIFLEDTCPIRFPTVPLRLSRFAHVLNEVFGRDNEDHCVRFQRCMGGVLGNEQKRRTAWEILFQS
jgi:hypothetical protein